MPLNTHTPPSPVNRAKHEQKKRRLNTLGSLSSIKRDVTPPSVSPTAEQSTPVVDLTGDDEAKPVVDLTEDTPPPSFVPAKEEAAEINGEGFKYGQPSPSLDSTSPSPATTTKMPTGPSYPSPFHLTSIRDLPKSSNHDTTSITSILSNPLLSSVWIFNYCHDIEWTMEQLDADVRAHIAVTFIHGYWRKDDQSRIAMEVDAQKYKNVKLAAAYMGEMFGTHHSKIFVLFRRDDLAQVVIHTANMIAHDWGNMTQAAWLSPLLPLLPASTSTPQPTPASIGETFKTDFLSYLRSYAARTKALCDSLSLHDFGTVRGVFIGSVPGRHQLAHAKWGWPRLARVLSQIPSSGKTIVAQISSIATFGQNDTWLTPVLFKALSTSSTVEKVKRKAKLAVIFPTVAEVRASLNGYMSGASIHLRLGSAAQKRQLEYVKPLLHHWSSLSFPSPESEGDIDSAHNHAAPNMNASRSLAAPHIKTYIRFEGDGEDGEITIDWALLTSANLSTQAWGAAAKDGMYRVCSYEAGVLVHPGLWGDERSEPGSSSGELESTNNTGKEVKLKTELKMRPVFKRDSLKSGECGVALRMPYSLPIRKYSKEESGGKVEIWWNGGSYKERDWLGQQWVG